ncbi:MAG: integrase [Acidobacteria bacterium]|nr:MAG: integrase [Acidobacteriota bacterium]
MQDALLRIEPLPGYSPAVGRLVGILLYARATTIAAVEGLTLTELDHLHDDRSNSIGALLAHIAVVERAYQVLTLEDRALTAEENLAWAPALKLGPEGRQTLRGEPLQPYLERLAAVRRNTLDALALRDDAWLDRRVTAAPKINMHWAWFHVAEDEINHRGQMRWLRARLPQGSTDVVPDER